MTLVVGGTFAGDDNFYKRFLELIVTGGPRGKSGSFFAFFSSVFFFARDTTKQAKEWQRKWMYRSPQYRVTFSQFSWLYCLWRLLAGLGWLLQWNTVHWINDTWVMSVMDSFSELVVCVSFVVGDTIWKQIHMIYCIIWVLLLEPFFYWQTIFWVLNTETKSRRVFWATLKRKKNSHRYF